MKALIIKPGEKPVEVSISSDELISIIGGEFQVLYLFDEGGAIVCRKDALYRPGEHWNRIVDENTIIYGNFVICEFDGDSLIDLSQEQLEFFMTRFRYSHILIPTDDGVIPI